MKAKLQRLQALLEDYMSKANTLIKRYLSEKSDNSRIYATEVANNMNTALEADTKKAFENLRNEAKGKVDAVIQDIRKDIQKWVTEPDKSGVLASLSAVKSAGLKLSLSEIQAFMNNANGNYLSSRLLAEMAEEQGYIITAGPQIESYEQMLKSIESGSNKLIQWYSGENIAGYELLPHNFINGIDYGEIPAYVAITANSVLKPDSDLFLLMSKSDNVKTSSKITLTAERKDEIDAMFEGYSGEVYDRTQSLIRENPALRDELMLHERYAEYVPLR